MKRDFGIPTLLVCLLAVAEGTVAQVFVFGEGWSSENPGGAVSIYHRAFTIHTGEEACRQSGLPVELRVSPSPMRLRSGQRLYRSDGSEDAVEISVEAYDSENRFLPRVPIIVDVIDPSGLMSGRSDWDYIEATKPGEAILRFSWFCPTVDGQPISVETAIVVTEN